jgi:hypothetical protein
MQMHKKFRSHDLDGREMDHHYFGKPLETFSVLSLSLDARGTYEKALIWDDKVQFVNAVVDAEHCGELCFWTEESIPLLLKSQPLLASAWSAGWQKGFDKAEQLYDDWVYDICRYVGYTHLKLDDCEASQIYITKLISPVAIH